MVISFILPHTIFNLTSEGKEMVFSLELHVVIVLHVVTGHQIANVGVAFKVNETYLLSMFG